MSVRVDFGRSGSDISAEFDSPHPSLSTTET